MEGGCDGVQSQQGVVSPEYKEGLYPSGHKLEAEARMTRTMMNGSMEGKNLYFSVILSEKMGRKNDVLVWRAAAKYLQKLEHLRILFSVQVANKTRA